MKEVQNQNLWNYELGRHENMNIPIWINIGFQERNRQDSQKIKKDTFCRLPVIGAQGVIGMENYTDARILLNYDSDDYSQEYG